MFVHNNKYSNLTSVASFSGQMLEENEKSSNLSRSMRLISECNKKNIIYKGHRLHKSQQTQAPQVCQPSSPNSFVNLSCTSRSDLLTVGLCLASTLSKSVFDIGGGMIYRSIKV